MANEPPALWLLVCEAMPQLSVSIGGSQPTVASQLAVFTCAVILAGQFANIGASLSDTVISKEQAEVSPALSVAVYVTVVIPNGNISPELCVELNKLMPQLSVAFGAAQLIAASQTLKPVFAIILTGQPVITGFSASTILILKEQIAVSPALSVAVYVTVVIPNGNISPELCVELNKIMPQLSVAIGAAQLITASQTLRPVFAEILTGQPVITGFSASTIFILKEQIAVSPALSVAVYITVVIPNGIYHPNYVSN